MGGQELDQFERSRVSPRQQYKELNQGSGIWHLERGDRFEKCFGDKIGQT